MTATKTVSHTPGPWAVEQGECNPLIVAQTEDGPLAVADVLDDCYPATAEQQANARLIAAAPDLLHALKLMVSAFSTWKPPYFSPATHAMETASAAVRKADASQPK